MKTMKTPIACAVLAASMICITSQVSAVDLLLRNNVNGDGINSINVTGKDNGNNGSVELAAPIYTSWGNGTTTGDSWGGGDLGGLTFSMEVTDFNGNSAADDAQMNGDGGGLGIMTAGFGADWEIDGLESFSMTGTQDYDFQGFKSRGGYSFDENANRQVSFSSASWGELNSIDGANDLGDGVSFSIDGGIGTFVIGGAGIEFYKDTFTLTDILGAHVGSIVLSVNSGDSLTIDNHLDATGSGIALEYLSISTVPEPGTYALLAGCFALASVMIRRRR